MPTNNPVNDKLPLPDDILYEIFSFFNKNDLTKNALVSKQFNKVIKDRNMLNKAPWPLLNYKAQRCQISKTAFDSSSKITAVKMLSLNKIALGQEDGNIIIRDLKANTIRYLAMYSGDRPITALATLKNGDLVSANKDGLMIIWDMNIGAAKQTMQTTQINSIIVLANDDIVCGCEDGAIRIFTQNGEMKTELPCNSPVYALTELPNNKLVSGSKDFKLKIWDLNNKSLNKEMIGHQNNIRGAVLLPNGDLVSVSSDKTIRVWDLEKGQPRLPILKGHSEWIYCVKALPQPGYVATTGYDGTVRIWDFSNIKENENNSDLALHCKATLRPTLDNDPIYALEITPRGDMICASFRTSAKFHIWEFPILEPRISQNVNQASQEAPPQPSFK